MSSEVSEALRRLVADRAYRVCEYPQALPAGIESQRDSIIQPRVARNELPWVKVQKNHQP